MDAIKSAIIGASLIALWYFFSRSKANRIAHQQGCEPPPKYPHKDPFFGLDYILGTHFDMPSISHNHLRYGNTFQTNLMGGVQLNTCSPQNARSIIGLNKQWGVESLRLPGMDLFCGKGIITSDGTQWEHSKDLLKYMFRTTNIVKFSAVDLAVEDLLQRIPNDGTTFLHTATHFLLGFSALSETRDSENIFGDVESFTNDFHDSMFLCGMRIVLGFFRFLIPRRKFEKAFKSSHQFLDFYINRAFDTKRSRESENGPDSDQKSTSLIEGLVYQTNDKIEIRNQTLQMLMAASDTVSILLSNSTFLLSRNPQVWKDLRAESLSRSSEALTVQTLNAPGLLRNVLFEGILLSLTSYRLLKVKALRLYPVFPVLGRVALVDTTLPVGGGSAGNSPIFVPSGTRADVSFYTMFRDKSIFGPDADQFVPSRWETLKPDQWEFLPFGRGPRVCVGRKNALLEASYVLMVLAGKFARIESRDDKDYKAHMKLTCGNGNGCKVALFEN
ncbi:Cytochrome P450 monooxygenase lepH [Lachnellula suecica]|uniref:Cytochrome P450 monooxygenase lepH n=1 Tax=Lachnellula suecica TaxID=602035 RepID=A0A8T9C5D5_9HELO|nr:Cytochrome P450 monooxygenase lepH [Lachnellula suecica]